jgi:lipopolysaccharide/colanic/teichoic acid biosynthesis glycosyltransferase
VFRQRRVGVGGTLFTIYKLRTMRQVTGPSVTAAGDARVTSIGRVLRKTKIDELPTLWNVVRGDMRLVGPRPEVPHLVDTNNRLWARVLEITPGITDPITVFLRNEEAILQKAGSEWQRFYVETMQPFKLRGYLDYQDDRSWRSDFRVLAKTVVAVFWLRSSSSQVEQALLSMAENR